MTLWLYNHTTIHYTLHPLCWYNTLHYFCTIHYITVLTLHTVHIVHTVYTCCNIDNTIKSYTNIPVWQYIKIIQYNLYYNTILVTIKCFMLYCSPVHNIVQSFSNLNTLVLYILTSHVKALHRFWSIAQIYQINIARVKQNFIWCRK